MIEDAKRQEKFIWKTKNAQKRCVQVKSFNLYYQSLNFMFFISKSVPDSQKIGK